MDEEAKMFFCSKCSNLLYPNTDNERQMRWLCRACNEVEVHDGVKLVFQMNMRRELTGSKALEELAMFALDPTAPTSTDKECPRCGRSNIAWFINPLEQPIEDMSLFFACKHCKNVWKDKDQAPESVNRKR